MTDPRHSFFRESAIAHAYCHGKGLEIGGAAHNPFGLDALNVDMSDRLDTEFKLEEIRICGTALPVDVVAPGDDIPLPDGSQDFIVSSHVLEHFPDPVKALLEWDRLLKPGGIIFAIVPHKERTMDRDQPRTALSHLVDDFIAAAGGDFIGHYHYWITEDLLELVVWMIETLEMKWKIEAVADVDDKVGNGFTIVVRKLANRRADEGVEQLRQRAARGAKTVGTGPESAGWFERLELQKLPLIPHEVNEALPALKELIESLQEETTSAAVAIKAGELCFNLGIPRNAAHFFEKAALLSPGNGDALNNLGVISYQQGDHDRAREYFARAVGIDPANENARKNLAAVSAMAGR
ncbi:methyltransferase domain-containing protein [Geobacter pickeringii]|uniref:methyltransferase domain-containing protein n=1 Tax=Geobacter pickeringii TaxID=345632 RepID=UPI00068B5AC8|nr:methyltransferase domain-containing protein [Geobacter pickeringii]